jgi:hypothetical protein
VPVTEKPIKPGWPTHSGIGYTQIRICIAFIGGTRERPQEFEKRLRYFIEMTEKNKQFGFGGVEKYY